MEILGYFIAVCEEERDGFTVYPSYIVNNSTEEIDVMIVVRPGAIDKVNLAWKTVEFKEEIIDGTGIRKYRGVPPKSYIVDELYFDWDFDWINERLVWFKTSAKDECVHFKMDRYFIAGKKIDYVPVLNKSGWICL